MTLPHISEQTASSFGGVIFGIRNDGDDIRLGGWSQENITNTRHVPGGNRNITFQMGRGPMTLTLRVELGSREDHAALQLLVGEEDTLQIPQRVSELVQTTETDEVTDIEYWGITYQRITDVILQQCSGLLVEPGTGRLEAVLEFQRNERPE